MADEFDYQHPVPEDAGSASLDTIGDLRSLSSRRLRVVADECERIIQGRMDNGVFD